MPVDFYFASFVTATPLNREKEIELGLPRKRQETLKRLFELGIHKDVVAQSCEVTPRTVDNWREGSPFNGVTARRAIDRFSFLLQHIDDDLGLPKVAALKFLTTEPVRTQAERGLELDIFWTPEYEAACNLPLVTVIGTRQDGLITIYKRLRERFPERYAEIDFNTIHTPAEDNIVLHQNDLAGNPYS